MVGCDDEQGDLFYSASQREKLRRPKLMQFKSRDRREDESKWTGNVENRTRKMSLAVGEACMAILSPTPGSTRICQL